MAMRGRRSRWAPTRPLPLVGCPRPQGACAAPVYQGLDHSGWVPRGWGGCRGWVGGEEKSGWGGERDWMGVQRGAERRDKAKRVTITKENAKKKKVP